MDKELVEEIIGSLTGERTLYHYYKDRYAAYLLERRLQGESAVTLAELRRSKFGKLLNKPVVKALLKDCGDQQLKRDQLECLWNRHFETYVLTLGTWGAGKRYQYYQTSRPGSNLVLQMNFNGGHDQIYKRNIVESTEVFTCYGHPVSQTKVTLAWARIDLDLVTGEALIEEIQNDWIRQVSFLLWQIELAEQSQQDAFEFYGRKVYVDRARHYLEEELHRHKIIWSEAMLNAAIQFLFEEIGLNDIYYHSFETGALLKHIEFERPPKSIYTKLPKQFCFDLVDEGPSFINKDKHARRRLKKIDNQQWYRLTA